jgi:hypothetical protein
VQFASRSLNFISVFSCQEKQACSKHVGRIEQLRSEERILVLESAGPPPPPPSSPSIPHPALLSLSDSPLRTDETIYFFQAHLSKALQVCAPIRGFRMQSNGLPAPKHSGSK